jgi:antitoxin PrlF
MRVNDKGQVTIPKQIRMAAGVASGSEVAFSLDGSKIVITRVGTSIKEDRRAKLKLATAKVRGSFSADFKQLGAGEIMRFIRGDESTKRTRRRGALKTQAQILRK